MSNSVGSQALNAIISVKNEEENAKYIVNDIVLLNSVSKEFWSGFKSYLIAQKQSKSSIRNKIGCPKVPLHFGKQGYQSSPQPIAWLQSSYNEGFGFFVKVFGKVRLMA